MTITNLNTQNIYRLRTTQIVQNIIIKVKPKTGQGFCFKEHLCGQLGMGRQSEYSITITIRYQTEQI